MTTDLSKNEFQGRLPPAVATALAGVDMRFYRRQPQLSQRIAEYMNVDESLVLVGNGAEEILLQLFQSLVRKEKSRRIVLLPSMTWPFYDHYIAEASATKVEFDLGDGFTYEVERILEGAKCSQPELTVLCSPNNPTGSEIAPHDLARVLEETDSIVVLDQTYHGFSSRRYDYTPLFREHKNLVILRSFSKFFGLAGARVGWALIHAETRQALRLPSRKLGLSVVLDALGCAALDSLPYYEQKASELMRDRDHIIAAINRTEAYSAPQSNANFIWVKCPGEKLGGIEHLFAVEGFSIYVFPAGKYYGYIRFGICRTEDAKRLQRIFEH